MEKVGANSAHDKESFWRRLTGALLFDPVVYDDVEADTTSWTEAVLVVVLSSIAMGAGALGTIGLVSAAYSAAAGLFGWFLWAGLAFVIGVWLLPGPNTFATWGQLLRTTAFATVPGIFAISGIIPALTGFAVIVFGAWVMAAFVVAVREALDYAGDWRGTLRALAVCLLGWAVYAGIVWAFLAPGAQPW